MNIVMLSLAFLILAPIAGGLLAGIDRIVSARLQSRVGPPLLQPFYDVLKLWDKENLVVRRSQNFYIFFFLILTIFTGMIFFSGGDLLLVIFAFTLADVFFVLGGYKASSPYSSIGSHRELIQIMSYEPAILFTAIGLYMLTKSFSVAEIVRSSSPAIIYLPGIFLCFLYVLPIKFRKSPFDLSTSHHGHQELVKGITTEFSGKTLAAIEIAHWYENIIVLGMLSLFFSFNWPLALGTLLFIYFITIVVDNVCARLRWDFTLGSSWAVALVLGAGNIIILDFLKR